MGDIRFWIAIGWLVLWVGILLWLYNTTLLITDDEPMEPDEHGAFPGETRRPE